MEIFFCELDENGKEQEYSTGLETEISVSGTTTCEFPFTWINSKGRSPLLFPGRYRIHSTLEYSDKNMENFSPHSKIEFVVLP